MNKEEFFKSKLNNFSEFIKDSIGTDNEIFSDVSKYRNNINIFLTDLITLSRLASVKDGKSIFMVEDVNKYLEYKKINKKVDTSITNKLMLYLNMFLEVLNY